MLALGENRLGDAQTLLLDLLEVAPGCGPAWTRLAQVCARFGDHENAYQAYMRAVEYDPTRVQALVSLANIYQRQGLLSEALMHLRLALHAEPANDALRAEVERLTRKLEDR